MTLEILPVIDHMLACYAQPPSRDRFRDYLRLLGANRKDQLDLPLGGYNPMAKEPVIERLRSLRQINAEQIVAETLEELQRHERVKQQEGRLRVALVLADDLAGGWTNRFTSDYDHVFRFSGLFNRGFCTPVCWAGEDVTGSLIRERVAAAVFRSLYWYTAPKPATLEQHLEQEIFVAAQAGLQYRGDVAFDRLQQFYDENRLTENYHLIVNFFYGDQASLSLGLPPCGITGPATGFDYARKCAAGPAR